MLQTLLGWFFGSDYRLKVIQKRGGKVGHKVNYFTMYMPHSEEAPYLSIGNYTTISNNVHFIFHDGSIGPLINRNPAFILKNVFVKKGGAITIGNHVFIGHSSIILPGVHIGDYSVIGAGSVVTKDIPSYEVWGGVPARKLPLK